MTKVSVFGQDTQKGKKPIEFVEGLNRKGGTTVDIGQYNPRIYDNVVLYSASTQPDHYDIILAYDDDIEGKKAIFLGHWNDGFVE